MQPSSSPPSPYPHKQHPLVITKVATTIGAVGMDTTSSRAMVAISPIHITATLPVTILPRPIILLILLPLDTPLAPKHHLRLHSNKLSYIKGPKSIKVFCLPQAHLIGSIPKLELGAQHLKGTAPYPAPR